VNDKGVEEPLSFFLVIMTCLFLAEGCSHTRPTLADENIENLHWQEAQAENTTEAYSLYISRHPAGKYVSRARENIRAQENLKAQQNAINNGSWQETESATTNDQ
jgi:hypothetical protein